MIETFQGWSGRIAGFSMGCCLVFAGCPAGPSTPAPGTQKSQQRTGAPPGHTDFLDGLTQAEKQLTPEQMAERERKKIQMIYLMDLATAPPLEAAAMLETAMEAEARNPGEYGQGMLRHHGIRIFYQLIAEEILDEALARAVLRLGETLRKSDQLPLTMVVGAMVKCHDYLGEPEKGDELVDSALEMARKPRQDMATARPGLNSDSAAVATQSLNPSSPTPTLSSPGTNPQPAISTSSTATPAAGNPAASPRVIAVGGNLSTVPNHELPRLLELKAMRLARRDFAAADALLQAECRVAREAMVATPDAIKPVYDWRSSTERRARIARLSGRPDLADEIDKEREETIRKVVEAHPDSARHYSLSVTALNDEVGRLIRNDPKQAKSRLTEIQNLVEGSKFAQDPVLAPARKSWEAYDRMIAAAQSRHDLIGRPAPPLDVERWVHGEPLPLDSLKGRVVLLAFGQVNRAATVELFPWLNSLHEEWHDRGLDIIQVVRPIHMTWNPKVNRAETVRQRISLKMKPATIPNAVAKPDPADEPLSVDRSVVAAAASPATTPKASPDPAVAIEAEVQMLEQLATHYGHRFPTILTPAKSSMPEAYGGKVAPYLVAIDRQGNIRAIEDRSTDESRRSIREQLERLLAE